MKLWEVDTKLCVQQYTGHGDVVRDIKVTSSETFLSAANDWWVAISVSHVCILTLICVHSIIREWNIHSGQCLKDIYGHEAFVYGYVNVILLYNYCKMYNQFCCAYGIIILCTYTCTCILLVYMQDYFGKGGRHKVLLPPPPPSLPPHAPPPPKELAFPSLNIYMYPQYLYLPPLCTCIPRGRHVAEIEITGGLSAIFHTFQPYDRPNTYLSGHDGRPEALLVPL